MVWITGYYSGARLLQKLNIHIAEGTIGKIGKTDYFSYSNDTNYFFLHFQPPIFRLMEYKGLVQQMVSDICKHIVEAFFHSYISILSLFSRSSPVIAVKEVTHQGRIQSLMPPFLRQPEISQWLTVFFKDILSFRTFDSVAISRKPDRASAIHQSSLFVRH